MLAALILLAACGSPASPDDPREAIDALQRPSPTTTISNGRYVPAAPEESPAYEAMPEPSLLPGKFELITDERFGRAHESSSLSYQRGFIAGRLQLFTANQNFFALQTECGEFRNPVLASEAVVAEFKYTLSAHSDIDASEVDVAAIGDDTTAISGTIEIADSTFHIATVWFTTDALICAIEGYAIDGDPLALTVAAASTTATAVDAPS